MDEFTTKLAYENLLENCSTLSEQDIIAQLQIVSDSDIVFTKRLMLNTDLLKVEFVRNNPTIRFAMSKLFPWTRKGG